ncbi:MAG: hypothetical protein DRG33_07300 [Deltaproteobacteria bacterium]|nr:MAG: hypothetical protein DRG33_07300 [Deltaproteobacteria bacterium]
MVKRILFVLFLTLSLCLSALAGERFIDNGDGTVTDTKTGLMWTASDNMGDISWHDAKDYCKMPPVAGYRYTDWRMPTVEELRTLYDPHAQGYEADCGLKVKVTPLIHLSCAWVWAAEESGIMGYVFDFGRGFHYSTLKFQKKGYRALAVRKVK